MAVPFIRDLAQSLQGVSALHTKAVELHEMYQGTLTEGFLRVDEGPEGFRVRLELWQGLEGKSLSIPATTEELDELSDMFAEAADISRGLS